MAHGPRCECAECKATGCGSFSHTVSAEQAWQELLEKDDRTSPEQYPEMCLITVDELRDFMRRAR